MGKKIAKEYENLILTTARVVRRKFAGEVYAEVDADLAALNEALKPFEPPSDDGKNAKRK